MDSKVFLVCLSGLCLSSYAAPFDPVATANSWVGSLSAQHVPLAAILHTPYVNPMTIHSQQLAFPVLKAATPLVNPIFIEARPVVKAATPVFKAATPIVKPIVIEARPSVKAATPVFKAATPVVKPIVIEARPVAVSTPVFKAATPAVLTPVFKATSVAVGSPVLVAAAPEPLDAPNPPMPRLDVPFVGGQFHAQDEMGQYAFGHHGGSNTRVETRDYLGRVTGSFSYVNPEGDVHVRKYAAASGMGFKVAGSDIPVDTPEVAAAKVIHSQAIATAKSASTT